jgi:tRNA G10  N-methylase Trm11
VPYLRANKFPRTKFPELYRYREVQSRLEAKVRRAFRRVPELNFALDRKCYCSNATILRLRKQVDAIITSPPYMRQLDYARDNRLRLFFLGVEDWRGLERAVSPPEDAFLGLMRDCFVRWRNILRPSGACVVVIGNTCSRENKGDLPGIVARLATEEIGGYSLVCEYTEIIPNERRVRRGIVGSVSETVVVLRRNSSGS